MKRQNVTLSLPRDLLRRARRLAIERGTSLSGLLAGYLERFVREGDGDGEDGAYEAARSRARRRLAHGYDLGSGGRIQGDREALHER